ncbi:hypothetical protein NCS52_00455600 [Fusarium sp. LHS14.1]|nr:hypothetical protein NCS52_00455600 [Fusarium sp. LHS14.1]
MVTALYYLESYWIIKTTWNMYTQALEIWCDKTLWGFFMLTVITFTYLVLWYLLGYGFCVVLDLPFTFVSELALMPLSADANHAPTSKGKKRPKKKAFRGNKKTYKDKQSTGPGSEESWQADLHG